MTTFPRPVQHDLGEDFYVPKKLGRKAKRAEELCSGLGVTGSYCILISAADPQHWVSKICFHSMTQPFSAHKLTDKIVIYIYKRLKDVMYSYDSIYWFSFIHLL